MGATIILGSLIGGIVAAVVAVVAATRDGDPALRPALVPVDERPRGRRRR